MIYHYVAYLIAVSIVTVLLARKATRLGVVRKGAEKASVVVSLLNATPGLPYFLTYTYFVLSSSAMTRLGKDKKLRMGLGSDIQGRTTAQVLAVGALPGVLGSVSAILSILNLQHLAAACLVAALSMLATSNADTWASEIGVLSNTKPRLILNPTIIAEAGTSGAVSPLGIAASIAGATSLALVSAILMLAIPHSCSLAMIDFVKDKIGLAKATTIIAVCGIVGEIADSILGLVLQEKRQCMRCGTVCECELHCNTRTVPLWGSSTIRGEHVNVLSQIISGVLAVTILKFT